MHPYNRQFNYPPDVGFLGPRSMCTPPRFNPNFGAGHMPFGPPPRFDHSRYPMPYPPICSTQPASQQHSPTYCAETSPPKRGPHTPPGPPPDDQPSINNHSPSKSKSNSSDYVDYPRQTSHWKQRKQRDQQRPAQNYYQKNQYQRNTRGRRNANQNYANTNGESSSNSVLNSAVQSYLLTMLTTQPPPNVCPTPTSYLGTPSTSLTSNGVMPQHGAHTIPPLPPTPVRPPSPPLPPSDEENWDTPSEDDDNDNNSRHELDFQNSKNQPDIPGIAQNTLSLSAPSINEPHSATDKCISPINAEIQENVDKEQMSEEQNSFKIKLPSRSSIVDPMETPLTVDIPNTDIATDSCENLHEERQNEVESILKIVTPNNCNSKGGKTQANEVATSLSVNQSSKENKQCNVPDIEKDINTDKTKRAKSKRWKKKVTKEKIWSAELAEKVIRVEDELLSDALKENVLILRFPDPPLSHDIVKNFSPDIEAVHFQQNLAPRYCFVHLKEGVDVDKTIEIISKIPFGNGTIKAELKNAANTKPATKPENIDPFTLYVGNLSTSLPCKVLKEYFPNSSRICVGFARRMKCTRYAFVQYHKVEDAIAAFRRMYNSQIEGRSLILRFKRLGNVDANEDRQLHAANDLNENNENHVETLSTISSSLTISSDVTEISALENNHTKGNEYDDISDKNNKLTQTSDVCSDTRNMQDIDRQCVKSTLNSNQKIFEEITSTSTESVNNLNDVVNSNLCPILNKTSVAVNGNATRPEEQNPHEASARESEFDENPDEDTEIACVERTENSNLKTLQTVPLQHQQGNVERPTTSCSLTSVQTAERPATSYSLSSVKTEELIPSAENTEKVVYSMRRYSQRLQNLKTGVNGVNKFENNEDFELFSDRTRRFSSSSLADTERTQSIYSHCSSNDMLDHLNDASMALNSLQNHEKDQETINELCLESVEDCNTDLDLLKQVLNTNSTLNSNNTNKSINCKTLLIDDGNSMTKYCQKPQQNMIDCNDGSAVDIVPSNALLMQRTETNSNDLQGLKIKEEQIELSNHNSIFESNSQKEIYQQKPEPKSAKRKMPYLNNDFIHVKQIVPSVVTEDDDDDDDDDDLVPANCALNLYHKPIHDLTQDDDPIIQIKREVETQDLFSLPKRTNMGKRPRPNEYKSNNLFNGVTNKQNVNSSLRSLENSNDIQAVRMRETCSEDDDDVVIISYSMSPPARQQLSNLSEHRLPDTNQKHLFQVKQEKNASTSIDKYFLNENEKPKKPQDNLDRLFALLNSNSDEEL